MPNATLELAVKHHRSGNLDQAEQLYREVLAHDDNNAEAMHNLGVVLAVRGATGEALKLLNAALRLQPVNDTFWTSLAETYLLAGRTDEAAQVAAEGLRRGLAPGQLAHIQEQARQRAPSPEERNRAAALFSSGLFADALAAARDLTARYPTHFYGWQVLATVLHAEGEYVEALNAVLVAQRYAPDNASVLNTLGVLQKLNGGFEAAAASFRAALAVAPGNDKAHSNLGTIYLDLGDLALAESAFRRACELAPDSAEAHNNLGVALRDLGCFEDSEREFASALELNPSYADAWCNLGVLLREAGKLEACFAAYDKALALQPNNLTALSNVLFAQNFAQSCTPQQALELARRYGAIAASMARKPFTHENVRVRKHLRLGFVSGDLREHVVSYFLEGVLAKLDRTRFELYAYPTTAFVDATTTRLGSLFSMWHPLYGLSNARAAQVIHDDDIDILFDLSGHTAHNRLPVFAYKPAPLQIAWLGYFATTGLAEMDYVLADAVGVPQEHSGHFVEKVLTLPKTRLVFVPPQEAPDVTPLPALSTGHVTFGCFQNFTKVHDEVLRLWAQVVAQVPNASLRLQCRQFADPASCAAARLRLEAFGLASNASLCPPASRSEYLRAHAEVDMILDSFPYPGGTTTCEALWMGVPTLTLCGDRLLSRQGASLLTAAGLSDWIARDEREFVEKAVTFARDRTGLAALRSQLRDRVQASSLCDSAGFAEDFAHVLESAWAARR